MVVTDQGAQAGARPSQSASCQAPGPRELRGDRQAKPAPDGRAQGPGAGASELGWSYSPSQPPRPALPDSAPALARAVPVWARPGPRAGPRAGGPLGAVLGCPVSDLTAGVWPLTVDTPPAGTWPGLPSSWEGSGPEGREERSICQDVTEWMRNRPVTALREPTAQDRETLRAESLPLPPSPTPRDSRGCRALGGGGSDRS